MLSDIISAVSTPKGTGGIAVIRISGNGCLEILDKVFHPKSKKSIKEYPPRVCVLGDISDLRSNVDSGVAVYYKGPHSFTGEDMAEISCHGGYTVTSMVLGAVLERGARMAEGGEFTRRAFINNKITLTEAEAIGNMLSATTQGAVRLSNRHINGALGEKIDKITTSLISLVSTLYASIDYPEEDLEDMTDDDLLLNIKKVKEEVKNLIDTYKSGHAVAYGINTVIVGKPNVGKSSFFNALARETKAIVTDIPGTTRDILEQTVEIDSVALRIFDTAGIREDTNDAIEKVGVNIAKEKLLNPETELVLALFDLSRDLDEEDENIVSELEKLKEEKIIIPVFTKCDKEEKFNTEFVTEKLGEGYKISSVKGDGVEEIKKEIISRFVTCEREVESGAVLTNVRQLTTLKKCLEVLEKSENLVLSGAKDMALVELEIAVNMTGEIDSRTVSEKIVDEIFSKFCVGK
ncbi:MAG: tRNA uridine-5-carboxymethylaminomethyl(34) synthesis GTPase MnmE [Ruminococcaceae bacterium]|nr:tRNA uridine-5-carboxymethylaminomethyl(34) synthesis GTPase MnmE [Oscillospiraceae bacterium]